MGAELQAQSLLTFFVAPEREGGIQTLSRMNDRTLISSISKKNKLRYPAKSCMSSIRKFIFGGVAVIKSFSAAANTTGAASGHCKSTWKQLQDLKEISQQTAPTITDEPL